ncbi:MULTISPECIES: PilZ domain-containing protein [Tepidiphilus]|nr:MULTISPECIES: PilZ domain-containing protein [Tepidiphilus]
MMQENGPRTDGPNTEVRPTVLSLNVANVSALYAAFMPFLRRGGVFVPTTKHYDLGDEVFLLLQLPDETERFSVSGSVVWITPSGVPGNRVQGIGVHFAESESSEQLRVRIERKLGALLGSGRTTHTL